MELLSLFLEIMSLTANLFILSLFYVIWMVYDIKKKSNLSQNFKISFFSFILSMALTLLLKAYFQTTRPCCPFNNKDFISALFVANKYGFPSGHAARASIIVLSFFRNAKIIRKILLIFWLLLVSYSRIYLQKHTLIDIIGGIVVGIFSYVIIHYIYAKKK